MVLNYPEKKKATTMEEIEETGREKNCSSHCVGS